MSSPQIPSRHDFCTSKDSSPTLSSPSAQRSGDWLNFEKNSSLFDPLRSYDSCHLLCQLFKGQLSISTSLNTVQSSVMFDPSTIPWVFCLSAKKLKRLSLKFMICQLDGMDGERKTCVGCLWRSLPHVTFVKVRKPQTLCHGVCSLPKLDSKGGTHTGKMQNDPHWSPCDPTNPPGGGRWTFRTSDECCIRMFSLDWILQ